jgi:hypothetical protein
MPSAVLWPSGAGLNLRSGKPVPAANFHVTLLFLGDVDAAQVPALCAVRRCRPLALLARPLQVRQRAGPGAGGHSRRRAALGLVYGLRQALLSLVEAPTGHMSSRLDSPRSVGRPPSGRGCGMRLRGAADAVPGGCKGVTGQAKAAQGRLSLGAQ